MKLTAPFESCPEVLVSETELKIAGEVIEIKELERVKNLEDVKVKFSRKKGELSLIWELV